MTEMTHGSEVPCQHAIYNGVHDEHTQNVVESESVLARACGITRHPLWDKIGRFSTRKYTEVSCQLGQTDDTHLHDDPRGDFIKK